MSPVKLVDPITGEFIRYADRGGERGNRRQPLRHRPLRPRTGPHAHPDLRRRADAVYTPRSSTSCPASTSLRRSSSSASRCVKNPEVLRRIVREGHMVGNHTMSHLDFDTQTDFRNREEIVATDRVIRATADYATPLVPHPHGRPGQQPAGAAAVPATRLPPGRLRPGHQRLETTRRARKCPSRRWTDAAMSCCCMMPAATARARWRCWRS